MSIQRKSKMVFAVTVISGQETEVLVYRQGDGWHFPGGNVTASTDEKKFIRRVVMEAIDGIKINSCELIETFIHDDQCNNVYYIVCSGKAMRHGGLNAAGFLRLGDLQVSSTGEMIRQAFNKNALKPPEEILKLRLAI
jgi:hypothetical protein